MSSALLLKNLFALAKSMRINKLDYQVINKIEYKKELHICALFKFDYIDIKNKYYSDAGEGKEYILGLFKRKTNEYLELPLNHKISDNFEAFELPIRLEDNLYFKLRNFLEINSSDNGPFRPIDFFDELNNAILTKANVINLDRLVCSYSYPTTKDNEHNKIYFSHFLNNDLRDNKRSLENYEKTEKLLHYANKIIGKTNISVCFNLIKNRSHLRKQS